MTTKRPSPGGSITTISLSLFLLTGTLLEVTANLHPYRPLWHLYKGRRKAQTDLTESLDCQHISHIWAHCKQPPRCLWCRGGHCDQECSKGNDTNVPKRYNCEPQHASSYRGCRCAKELQLRKLYNAGPPATSGYPFITSHSSRHILGCTCGKLRPRTYHDWQNSSDADCGERPTNALTEDDTVKLMISSAVNHNVPQDGRN